MLDTVFYDSQKSLFKKIKTTIPPESLKYLEQVQQTLHVGIKPFKDYAKFRGIIDRVNEAALKKRTVEIVYYTMSRKKETRRRMGPIPGLVFQFHLLSDRGEAKKTGIERQQRPRK